MVKKKYEVILSMLKNEVDKEDEVDGEEDGECPPSTTPHNPIITG